MNPRLIIFDIDGTLADRETSEILPGVLSWFSRNTRDVALFALATNQGGVGLRYWMERDGFGEPDKYPTEKDAWRHIHEVANKIVPDGEDAVTLWLYVCFAYQSKKGLWSPTPPGCHDKPEWKPENRKPAPGMLLMAMQAAEVTPAETLMVGDSNEDQDAADMAGCSFRWADEFFRRNEDSE